MRLESNFGPESVHELVSVVWTCQGDILRVRESERARARRARRRRASIPAPGRSHFGLIAIRFDLRCFVGSFGSATVKTPVLKEAATLSCSPRLPACAARSARNSLGAKDVTQGDRSAYQDLRKDPATTVIGLLEPGLTGYGRRDGTWPSDIGAA